jgi:ribosome-associated protein
VEAILLEDKVRVPAEAIAFRAVRSGGPGGQNVNKVSSKVELRVELALIEGLDAASEARLRFALRNQLDADGRWIVTSDLHRDQLRNLEEARAKVAQALARCLVAPKPRHATRPTRASQVRRVDAKKREGAKKKDRRGGWE